MKCKKGIELSINFLVIIIFSLGILGMSILLFNKFFEGAQKMQTDYDKQTEQQLESLLVAGKRVAIPFTRKEVQQGKTAVFGLGILSLKSGTTTYYIKIVCDKLIKPASSGSCPVANRPTVLVNPQQELDNNEHVKTPIAISTYKDTSIGTYIFNVCVCDNSLCITCPPSSMTKLYDENLHKLYLKVI